MFKSFIILNKEKEFSKFIDKYTPYVSTIVYNISRENLTHEDIEEVVANVFIAVWQQNVNLKKDNIKSYLAGITRNTTLNYLRKVKNFSPLDDNEHITSSSDIVEDIEKKELSKLISQLVGELPEPDKSIFLKYYWFCLDTKKIAEDLNLNRSTVMSKLSRTREKLKKKLMERGYDYEKV